MNIEKFKENVISLMSYQNGDEKFAALRVYTHGMASSRFAKAINFAVKCLEEGEFYAEIGTYSGFSLISAGYENTSPCIGIDDLSMPDFFKKEHSEGAKNSIREILHTNMNTFGFSNLKHIESDFRNVVFDESQKGKMGVLLIDGKHTAAEVNDTLTWATPYLSKDSVILFDDVSMADVSHAVCDLWKVGGDLLYYAGTKCHSEVSGYGVAIMAIKKAA